MKQQPTIDLANPPAGAIPATEEQLAALGVTPEEIQAGEKRHQSTHRGAWNICTSLFAIVEHSEYGENSRVTRARFWPARRMTNPRSMGYDMEGRLSLGGKKIPAFTSSQLFELPNGHLVSVATLHLCHRTPAGDAALANL
jgi:hypothetical protein